mgnify:CR=1 FL=1
MIKIFRFFVMLPIVVPKVVVVAIVIDQLIIIEDINQ